MKGFIDKVVEYLEELELGYPIRVGIFEDQESIVVIPTSGTEIVYTYMDGTMDIKMPFSINIKSKCQQEAFHILNDVMNHIRKMGNFLAEQDDDHILLDVMIDQIPFFEGRQADGYFYYNSKIATLVTTK